MRPVHGGVTAEELRSCGVPPEGFVDFSVNINPLGPSPMVGPALSSLDLAAYPDQEGTEVKKALSVLTGVSPGRIVLGNGSTQLIHLLARTCLNPGDRAVIFAPTFCEYEVACRLAGARVAFVRANEASRFVWDMPAALRKIKRLRPRLVFLCNPNNPTGIYLNQSEVEELALVVGDGLLVLDEAYISFVEGTWASEHLLSLGNVVLLHSLTKDYALAALRLGYALCPEGVAAALTSAQPFWSINSLAQKAGAVSLSDREHLERSLDTVARGKAYLRWELAVLGLKVPPSAANFLLVEVGDAAGVRASLLRRGCGVRDCSSFGLPRYIRIGARTVPECERLIAALKSCRLESP